MTRASADSCVLIVVDAKSAPYAEVTIRSARRYSGLPVVVLDVEAGLPQDGTARVLDGASLYSQPTDRAELADAAATLDDAQWLLYLQISSVRKLLESEYRTVVVVGAGVMVRGSLTGLANAAADHFAVVPAVPNSTEVGDTAESRTIELQRARGMRPLVPAPPPSDFLSRALYAVGRGADLAGLRDLASDWRAQSGWDRYALAQDAKLVRGLLAGPWDASSLEDAVVVDLTTLARPGPWQNIPDPAESTDDRRTPDVLVTLRSWGEVASGNAAEGPLTRYRRRFSGPLRSEARRAVLTSERCPDFIGERDHVTEWATQLLVPTHRWPLARYLMAVWTSRPGLMRQFTRVPGPGSEKLARWALNTGVTEAESRGWEPDLLIAAAKATLAARPDAVPPGPRPEGVNLVGFLSGELGLGVSGRLMREALSAAAVPVSTFDASHWVASRGEASYEAGHDVAYDLSLICVNGPETARATGQVADVVKSSYRIGMWYWEFEDFPRSQAAFDLVDEVWVATDFIRDAIVSAGSPVPVRTVLPPLPQRGSDPGPLPSRFGIDPARPWFLFTFDHLSIAPRKNPLGLIRAFRRAFPLDMELRPQLVIKSINEHRAQDNALAVRLAAATDPDVIVMTDYLPESERHVLVAHCTAYVSLHKAEGLGLTLAEAMAWGKPVVATGYGGPMQFCNDQNAFLVDWSYGHVPYTMGPYLKGFRWAEPDLEHAAVLMQQVIDSPELAAARGEQAAIDIATRHDTASASAHIDRALRESRIRREAMRRV